MLARFDKLNELRSRLKETSANADGEHNYYDEVLEILEFAFVSGCNSAYDDLGIFVNRDIPDTFMEEVNRSIAGKTTKERIDEYQAKKDIESILLVADTEYTRLFNEGGLQTAIINGATRKTWSTELDDKVRDTHQYLEGQTVGIGDYFYTYDGDSSLYPGGFYKADNNCNCRCELRYS